MVTSTSLNGLPKIPALILAGAGVCSALIALVIQVHAAALPYQLDYEEGNILNAAVRIVHGLPIYPDPHGWPQVMNPYGPVGYELFSWTVRMGGVEFFLPRILVLLSAVLCCVFVGLLVWKFTKSGAAGVGFGSMFLCIGAVVSWMPRLRVDLVALVISLAAMWVLVARRRWWWVSVVLMVGAVFTKHTAVAVPAACFLWLWCDGQRKLAIKMAGTGMVIGLCCFGYMQWRTHGTFLFYMTGTHADPFSWQVYFVNLAEHFEANAVLSALALVAVVYAIKNRKLTLPVAYVIFAILTTVTIGKAGSSFNHLMELSAALCLAGAAGWKELSAAVDVKFRYAAGVVVLFLAAIVVNNAMRLDFEPRMDDCDVAYEYVKNFRGERVVAENMGAVVLAGKTLWISNPFVYTQLVKFGGWSDADFQEQLRRGELDLVLTEKLQPWSDEMMKALEDNYHVERRFSCRSATMAYVPNRPGDQTAKATPAGQQRSKH